MTQLLKSDVERIIEGVLRNLTVEVTQKYQDRFTVEVKLNNELLTTTYFSINENYG
jgi:hypothetical protein